MDPTKMNSDVLNNGLLDELNSLTGILRTENNAGNFSQKIGDSLISADGKSIPILQNPIAPSIPQGETLDLIAEINLRGETDTHKEAELEAAVDRILEQRMDTLRKQVKQSVLRELQQQLKDNYSSP